MKYIKQDITELDCGVIAHGVNFYNGGVMGAGIALAIKNKWPNVFNEYKDFIRVCNEQHIDDLLSLCHICQIEKDLYVANCFTQRSIGHNGRYADVQAIKQSVGDAMSFAQSKNLPFYMPQIGCGLGGLSWTHDVEPIITDVCNKYVNVDTYICQLS